MMLFYFTITVLCNRKTLIFVTQIISRLFAEIFDSVKAYQVFPLFKIIWYLRLIICHQKTACPKDIPYAERNTAFNIWNCEIQVDLLHMKNLWQLTPVINRSAVLDPQQVTDITVTVYIDMIMLRQLDQRAPALHLRNFKPKHRRLKDQSQIRKRPF